MRRQMKWAKLMPDRLKTSVVPKTPIYFSEGEADLGPQVYFALGAKEEFDSYEVIPFRIGSDWGIPDEVLNNLSKEKAPYAFDTSVQRDMDNFLKAYQTLFLLVWYQKVDDYDVQSYLYGVTPWSTLLQMFCVPEEEKEELIRCSDMEELDAFAREHNWYK